MKTREHSGTDFGTSSGMHLHVGSSAPTSPAAGAMAVWTGTSWVFPGSTLKSPTIDIVNSWAASIATDDNDLVYLRKKNGIIYVMKPAPHTSGIWEKLDPDAVPVITDIHGAKLEDGSMDVLRDKLIISDETIEIQPTPTINIGWYQDQKAELFYYEGEGHWREVDLKTNKKLTEMVSADTLEFIG